MKPIYTFVVVLTLSSHVRAWDERDSGYNPMNYAMSIQQMQQYMNRKSIEGRPLNQNNQINRVEIPIINHKPDDQPAQKTEKTFFNTIVDVIKAPVRMLTAAVRSFMDFPIIKPIQETVRKAAGYVLGVVTGDSLRKSNPITFDKNGPAVLTINGVRNNTKQANEIRDFAKKIVGVEAATAIRNESFLGGIGDLIQSAGYELLGTLDKPVMDTYKALKQGLKENGVVIVFAHSQGTAVLNQARSLLTDEENSRIEAWQIGSEWNGSHDNTFNIQNKGDPIPIFNKAVVNSIVPFGENRLKTESIQGEGKGHSFHQYKDFVEKLFLKLREEKSWESYRR